jgi:hypothetical protein
MAQPASTTLAEALAKVTASGDVQLEPAGPKEAPVVPLRAHSAVLSLHSSVLRDLFASGCDVSSSPIKVGVQ